MPILPRSSYPGPPWYQLTGHGQTILPAFRQFHLPYRRERLELADSDFLDLDWLQHPERSNQLVILTHGLEGNSQRPYIQSAAQYFFERGWDALAWNCRSCSEEMNRLPRLYHHGEIGDIQQVVKYAITNDYEKILLAGYSMGGSINTKYLSVNGKNVPKEVLGGVAFSSPFDLAASVDALEFRGNGLYKKRFLRQLGGKLMLKSARFPGILDMSRLPEVKRWRDFDEWFTAPLLGLSSADEFYRLASAKNFLAGLQHPVLLVNALNDPIIPLACSPIEQAKTHSFLELEMPKKGGHVGFSLSGVSHSWMDVRAWEFASHLV